MIPEVITKQWDKNRSHFQTYIKQVIAKGCFVWEYDNLLQLIINEVINKDLEAKEDDIYAPLIPLDPKTIVKSEIGNWNGDYLYIIKPKYAYASYLNDWITYVYYGSCSGCDAMLDAESRVSVQEKTEVIMKLALEMVQGFRPIGKLYDQ